MKGVKGFETMERENVLRVCYECKGTATGRRENYHYTESGLKNIVLKNVLVYRCARCGATSVQIPNADGLHKSIAIHLLSRKSPLQSDEIRFLRDVAGFTATALARSVGVTKTAVSRWENGGKIGPQSEKSIRAVCGLAILEEMAREDGDSDAAKALGEVRRFFAQFGARSVLPEIRYGSIDSDRIYIDPEMPNAPFSGFASEDNLVLQ